jgi:hypothetical protein
VAPWFRSSSLEEAAKIVAILNAIQEHVNARADGPTLIDLDGHSYVMEAPA